MFERKNIYELNDFFKELNKRPDRGVYFCRIDGYNDEVREFVVKYYEIARKNGVVIEGRISNPTESNLAYYDEMMGRDFVMNTDYIEKSLRKWLPRVHDHERHEMAVAMNDTFAMLVSQGKNENMIKNTYIKFMCWLYYKFERIVNNLGSNDVPKIIYDGDISHYELLLLNVLNKTGCDIVLLQTNGESAYMKIDPKSSMSEIYRSDNLKEFPEGFGIKEIMRELQDKAERERIYGSEGGLKPCTNAWIKSKGEGIDDIKVNPKERESDDSFFYNCFIRINGVWDKGSYMNELYQMYMELKSDNRNVIITDGTIKPPDVDEIARIKRDNYKSVEQLIGGMAQNLVFISNTELRQTVKRAFINEALKVSDETGMNINRLLNRMVFLLSYFRRYFDTLFRGYKKGDVACFVHMGPCTDENDVMFLEFLAQTPVDVLILNPDLTKRCMLKSNTLYEINNELSLTTEHFPIDDSSARMGTLAYEAERELDSIMYTGTGLYRGHQYENANTITLKTMYEEISILWRQDLKYRPNFSITDGKVNIPVIFAKVCGVKEDSESEYFNNIRKLVTEDTMVITKVPVIQQTDINPVKPYVTEFYRNRKLLRDKIKAHSSYQYGYIKEEVQDYILDKLELLINSQVIKGTFENGMEYTIIATVLNMKKEIVRMIQNFDFTKSNPKIIYILTSEDILSREDAIVTAFLNLVGYDIIMFVPTGYESEGRFYNSQIMERHEAGEYKYDLRAPDVSQFVPYTDRQTFFDKIFKRGR